MPAKITVFIPVYNRQKYIAQTIQSVLDQSFKDFQLLLVDDGSTDNSVEIIRSFTDNRITLVENGRNLGIPQTRNIGLEYAEGEYLAILDSDDLMLKDRLKKQNKFLDTHADYAGVGSWSRYIDDHGKITRWLVMRPISHDKIKASLLFHCAVHNRTFMARAALIKKLRYDNEFRRCQDYELLHRISKQHKLQNLPEILVSGRKHDQQITSSTTHLGDKLKKVIFSRMLNDLGVVYDDVDLNNHLLLVRNNGDKISMQYLVWCESWFNKLLESNVTTKIYDVEALEQVIVKLWIKLFSRSDEKDSIIKNKKFILRVSSKYAKAYLR